MAANNIYIQVDFNSQAAQANVNALNQSIAATGPTADKSSKQATSGMNSIGISIQNVNKEFAQMASALAGLGISRAITGMVQLSSELSRTQLAMQSFTGSVAEANEVFEQVRAIAAQSPFRFKELEETAQRLLGFGMAAKSIPDTLKTITDQATRMGTGIEGVNTIVNVFGRIMEKNFVGAMDLMRALPAQGVPALKAIGAEMQKQLGHPVDVEEVRKALKDGILDPLQTIRVVLNQMRQEGGTGKISDDAARAFKNLGDTIDNVLGKLFGPQGFGPALRNLGAEITAILAPLGGLVDYLMKLPEATKEMIVNWTAGAAALAAFGTALTIVTSLASPLLGLTASVAKFTISLATMNPELALAAVLLGGLGYAAYKLIPQFKEFTDNLIDPLIAKVTGKFKELGETGRQFLSEALKKGSPIDAGSLLNTDDLFQKLREAEQKHAAEAQRTLLEALASPAEAVRLKYSALFAELEEKIKTLSEPQKIAVRGVLSGAEAAETAAAQFKENKKQLDEYTRYQVERARGAADAQVAYIEAQDAQDLRNKVRAIDKITQIRIDTAKQVGDIEKANLEKEFQGFVDMANQYRADFVKAGVDVDGMIAAHREETNRKETMVAQKQFDESQKYRLEGWKKANDVIIEDQRRVYGAFKEQFGQLFDVFTDKTKSLGQALGDFFKKLVIGEAKELFSTAMAGAATEAAGYGRPEESLARGGQGIFGTLLRRGTPPRPPLPPPEVMQIPAAVSSFTPIASSIEIGTKTFEIATDAYSDATIRFTEAVNDFRVVAVANRGSANRMADAGAAIGEGYNDAFQAASTATGVAQPLLRAVAQAESSMRPGAISPKGAIGLMQLMPNTAAGLGVNPYDVNQNVMGGAQHLQQLLTHYQGDVPSALAAYNMGQTGYDRRVATGRALPVETQNYVARITRMLATAPSDQAAAVAASASSSTPGSSAVSVQELANLPMTHTAGAGLGGFMLGGWGGGGEMATGGGALATPSVAELASLPQHANAMAGLAPLLLGGALKGAAGGKTGLARLGLPTPAQLGAFFGIAKGATSIRSVATSPAVGMLATLGGMALLSKGLQQRNAPATTIGGGLAGAGYVLSDPALLAKLGPAGIGAGAAAGAGLGLFASGFQRGGGTGLAMDVGGGALAGAGIGFMVGGPLGAAIGAGIGAAAGAITGVVRLFVKTENERIRTGIKQVYGIDISNQSILKQIQQIVDTKYGGSVTIGIRSQDVQDIVRLYALSTGQAAKLPRPMYAATIAQSQAGGLATQPVYQGGVQVQNPYTGATTYQYQTAVTAAQGLMAGTNQGVPGAGNTVSNIFMQLNPQQANDLFTGKVVSAVQQNPAAVASANASATRSGDSRVSQASNMLEPLTNLG